MTTQKISGIIQIVTHISCVTLQHFSNYLTDIFQKRRFNAMKNNMRLLLAKQRKKTADVAEATGISKSTLTALYYERAKNPSLDTLKKVSSYLGVTLDEFLDTKE